MRILARKEAEDNLRRRDIFPGRTCDTLRRSIGVDAR
jgi:hypothetical protein